MYKNDMGSVICLFIKIVFILRPQCVEAASACAIIFSALKQPWTVEDNNSRSLNFWIVKSWHNIHSDGPHTKRHNRNAVSLFFTFIFNDQQDKESLNFNAYKRYGYEKDVCLPIVGYFQNSNTALTPTFLCIVFINGSCFFV